MPETGLDATFSLLQPVDDELGAQTVSPLPGVSNVTAGLAGALPFLNSADADALKVSVGVQLCPARVTVLCCSIANFSLVSLTGSRDIYRRYLW